MHAMKNRVSRKFSRFFPDSSPQNPDQQPQARPCIEQEKSWSSLLSFSLPSLSFDRFKSSSHQNGHILNESHKCDRAYGNYEILTDEEYCGHGTNAKLSVSKKQHNNTIVDDDDHSSSARGTSYVPDVFEDAAEKFASEKSMPNLTDESLFISPNLYEFFDSSLPNIVKGCQWSLLYSTARDGISLRTLIRKSTNLSGPCLLITGDKKGAVFGGLLECPLKPTAKRKYQGSNQTFIFTTLYGEPRLFRPTGANRYFYLCLNDVLALGGGGNFALCLDEDLLTGSSGACETFGNLCLAHDQEFELKNVELWGFMHASRYLG